MRIHKKKLLLGIFLIACFLILFFYVKRDHSKPYSISTLTISTIKLKKESLPYYIILPSTLLSYLTVDLVPKIAGYIDIMYVDRGYYVKQGDLLAQLVDPQLDQDIEQAHAAYLAAQEQYNRAKPVVAQSVAREQFAGLRGNADVAFKAWQALLARRQFLKVTAPFEGMITTRYLHPGALVNEGIRPNATPIVRIDMLTRLRLVIYIPEAAVGSVRLGQQIPFTVSSYPGKTFYGVVARVSQALNLTTLTEPIELDVYNSNLKLMPGMIANVNWPATRSDPTFVVPKNAIVTTTYSMFVIRVKDNLTEWVPVERGNYYKDKVEIFGSLQEGDLIVTNATDELRENTKVRIDGETNSAKRSA